MDELRCLQGHHLALYLPAITAILVALLEGAVSDLPQDTHQDLHTYQALASPLKVLEPGQDPVVSLAQAAPPQAAAGGAGDLSASIEEQGENNRAEAAEGQKNAAMATETASRAEAAAGVPATLQGLQGPPQKSDGGREVRSGVLRLLASVWSRFPAQYHDSPAFARFFPAVEPLMRRIPTEVRFGHMAFLAHDTDECPGAYLSHCLSGASFW